MKAVVGDQLGTYRGTGSLGISFPGDISGPARDLLRGCTPL